MARMSTRRKLAIATWGPPREGNIYGKLTVDVTEAMAYLAWKREQSGVRVTMTHLVGRAVGLALSRAPGLNGRLLWGRYIPFERVDVAFLVALEGGKNLAKAKVEGIDKKSIEAIAGDLNAAVGRLREGRDDEFKKSQGPLKLLPTWLIRPIVWFSGFLTGALGLSMPALGLTAFPFGSCIITNVGPFGLDEAFAPHTPFARVPVLVLVGAVHEAAVVRDGQVVPTHQMTLTATIDHRFLDGAQGGILARAVREVFANPWSLEGLDGRPEALPAPAAAVPAPTSQSAPEGAPEPQKA